MKTWAGGGSYGWPPPPAASLARQGNLPPGRVIPGTECKKYKKQINSSRKSVVDNKAQPFLKLLKSWLFL